MFRRSSPSPEQRSLVSQSPYSYRSGRGSSRREGRFSNEEYELQDRRYNESAWTGDSYDPQPIGHRAYGSRRYDDGLDGRRDVPPASYPPPVARLPAGRVSRSLGSPPVASAAASLSGADDELPSFSLKVGNLSPTITKSDLYKLFGPIGGLKDVYIPRDYVTQQPREFGFVEFSCVELAKVARSKLDRCIVKGYVLHVQFAQSRRKTAHEMERTRSRLKVLPSRREDRDGGMAAQQHGTMATPAPTERTQPRGYRLDGAARGYGHATQARDYQLDVPAGAEQGGIARSNSQAIGSSANHCNRGEAGSRSASPDEVARQDVEQSHGLTQDNQRLFDQLLARREQVNLDLDRLRKQQAAQNEASASQEPDTEPLDGIAATESTQLDEAGGTAEPPNKRQRHDGASLFETPAGSSTAENAAQARLLSPYAKREPTGNPKVKRGSRAPKVFKTNDPMEALTNTGKLFVRDMKIESAEEFLDCEVKKLAAMYVGWKKTNGLTETQDGSAVALIYQWKALVHKRLREVEKKPSVNNSLDRKPVNDATAVALAGVSGPNWHQADRTGGETDDEEEKKYGLVIV